MKRLSLLPLSIYIFLTTGCSVGPSYVPPCVNVPAEWKNKNACQASHHATLCDWWKVFHDAKLEELECLALKNNRNLYVAFERIKEARALMGIAAADFYPQIFLNPQYTDTQELLKNYGLPESFAAASAVPRIYRAHELFYFLPVNLSYEVDLWGKIKDRYCAAKYNWLGIKKDYEALMLSLTTNLAALYYQLRTLDAQLDLLKGTLRTREKAYEITKARFEEKITFYADVTLAAEEVNSVLIQQNEFLRQRKVLENQIAVLLGVPASEFCLGHMPIKELPPCIPEGLPSDLLLRRPDLAEAEYNVRSRHSSVKEAYSLFFPSLVITSTGGFESPLFKLFLQWVSRYVMGGVQSSQLIFDGFRTNNNLCLQTARFKEAGGEYQQQVLIAFQETENALADIEAYAKEYDLAVSTVQLAQKTYQLYLDRYTLGVIYYIDVANTENILLNYQIDVNTYLGYRYLSTIQMIKAIGGSW